MKKTILMASLLGALLFIPAMSGINAKANNEQKDDAVQLKADPKDSYAVIKFDTLVHDFGKFSVKNPVKTCVFKFTNTGTAPLVLHQAIASCGCTVPDFSRTPVEPNQSGTIKVTYNGAGKFPGLFNKTVTIRSNAKNEVVRLVIKGDMTE